MLAHNAGIYPSATLAELDRAGWDHVQAVNVTSLFLLVRAALPQLKKQGGGRITVTSSITGNRTGLPALSHYATSKAALNGFIRSAAPRARAARHRDQRRRARHGPDRGRAGADDRGRRSSEVAAGIPLQRLAAPEDIGHAHLFLASSEASYVTGQTIVVDGGQILPEGVQATF